VGVCVCGGGSIAWLPWAGRQILEADSWPCRAHRSSRLSKRRSPSIRSARLFRCRVQTHAAAPTALTGARTPARVCDVLRALRATLFAPSRGDRDAAGLLPPSDTRDALRVLCHKVLTGASIKP